MVKPIGDRILVKPADTEEKTSSGIIVQSLEEKPKVEARLKVCSIEKTDGAEPERNSGKSVNVKVEVLALEAKEEDDFDKQEKAKNFFSKAKKEEDEE